jgi:glycosyltransferase involved in cell wall biosynthesis
MAGAIYYVGEFKFPDGEAASYRVLGNVKALRAGGFRVVAVGLNGQVPTDKAGSVAARAEALMPYHLVDEYGPRSAPRWKRVLRYALGGRHLVSWLKTHAAADAQAIILAGGYSRYLLRLAPLARKWNIPLATDVMEWFQPDHCFGGRFGFQRWDVELMLRVLVPGAGNVIAISSFLERYFLARGTTVVRVPPLVDTSEAQWGPEQSEVSRGGLRLGFIGNAAKKDLVVNAIRGLAQLGPDARACELRVVGPSEEELRTNLGSDSGLLETLGQSLHLAGRLPRREALHHLRQMDFSILLRPDLRFAHAGFPTKLVESMAMGVPVLCNLTSDIGLYVRDCEEGLVVKDWSPEAFADGVRRALALAQEQRMGMRAKARQRAQVSFDYRNWVEPFGGFIKQVMEGRRRQTP